MSFVIWSFVHSCTAKTMHYNHECCQWQNVIHIYAVCQYQIIVEIIIEHKCSQHICFSVWIVSCYLHAYNTEWYHLYCTLHRELCPWQLITCIRCLVRHIYREGFSFDREKVHHAHFMLHHSSSPASGVESKRWIHVLSVHRDENDSSDNFWWVLKNNTLYVITNYSE